MIPTQTTDVVDLQARMRAELNGHLLSHLPRLNWTAEQLATHQTERLRALLTHASENSAFHARRLAHIDVASVAVSDLAAIPVMTKTEMMSGFDEVVTDRRLNRQLVEAHLAASHAEASLLLGEYVCLASGGSSGQRGIFVQTMSEYADQVASILRRLVAVHIAFGAPGRILTAVVAAPAAIHSTGFGAAATKDGLVHAVPVPVTLPLPEAVRRLNELQPGVVLGYPSRIAQLGAEQQAGRLQIAPRVIISVAEMLTDADRQAIAVAFGAPVVNTFASSEGLVGRTEPGGTELTFANDMCLTELVDERRQPVPPGTPSASVLVTNLHNFTQPLLRYELNDSFTEVPGGSQPGHMQATICGRDDEGFSYGSVFVHPMAVRTVLTAVPSVHEYQVRQTPRGVDVDVVGVGQVDRSAVASAIADSLRAAGLPDPVVTLRTVDAITRHPDTGKARRFMPLQRQ